MSQNDGGSVINLDNSNIIITLNPATQFPNKLNGDNFPTWRAQLVTLLQGLDLLKYLDGSHPPPAPDAEAAVRIHWFRQDQLLLHYILASFTPSVAPYVTSAASSRDAWLILERMFASQSRQRIMNLKTKLSRETQGSRPVAVYLQSMRTMAAELALVQAPVSNEDTILHILRGLREEYGPLSAALRACDTTISLKDMHDRLVDFEADFEAHRSSFALAPTTVFSSFRGRSSQTSHGRGNPSSPRRSRQMQPSSYPDSAYRGHSPSRGFPNPAPSSAPSLPSLPHIQCQFCDKPGHTAKECYRLHGRPQSHHTVTAGSSSSSLWLLDSAATNHVTPDLGGLSLYTDYHGPEEVIVGDGSGLKITHIGQSRLPTSSSSLALSNILCVPAIKRRLLSVAQLCKSNSVSVEFFSDCFIVKDLATGAPLLCGLNNDDVYELPVDSQSPVRLALTATPTSFSTWHHRLGHPNTKLLSRLLRNQSLPASASSCSS
ncbi:unnamed protein product [Linum trigynum]|uniref:CCHC-type domain-containing protein n=1 Tax=Linum trigynum TaxID=586398 RepID=A0AAV2CC95_9ROSI